jgi:anti-sigma regulatory factor (Ser/Thr protein kinase)
MDKGFKSYSIEDRSFIAFVKREVHSELLQSNFHKNRIAEIDIILAELTSNLMKHANGGEILYRVVNADDKKSIFEILCVDSGPGISDVSRMMRDGVSTTNTLGHGLGSIQRLSDHFQIFSLPKWGTVSYTVVQTEERKPRSNSHDLEVKALVVPKTHEVLSGDGFAVKKTKDEIKVFLGDGLGHGEFAHEAVAKAADFFMHCEEVEPVNIIREMHGTVRKTRGLVGSVAVLNFKKREWKICGVGNIITRLYGGMMFKHYMSYNGIIGLNIPTSMKDSYMEAEKNQQLIMCSDGIRSRWDLTKYPSILKHDPMLLAAALYKDFSRRNDDTSVFIAKVNMER